MNKTNKLKKRFASMLLKWAKGIERDMPWKDEKDPYKIWLSEIILQQTRVQQGLPYYLKFVAKFPTVFALANASENEVLKCWEGLGYYSRGRNLHFTAKQIAFEMDGKFPQNYQSLLALKGVGNYTAAAIASFAYGEAKAVVDGNVVRLLARLFAIETVFSSTKGKRKFQDLADELLDPLKPAAFNQAIMDFGASICTPKSPDCASCTFSTSCQAKQLGLIPEFPVKGKKIKKRNRYFNFFDIGTHNIYIQQRRLKDIWQALYQLPLVETNNFEETGDNLLLTHLNLNIKTELVFEQKQELSHQKVYARVFRVESSNTKGLEGFECIDRNKIRNFAFPKILNWYFSE